MPKPAKEEQDKDELLTDQPDDGLDEDEREAANDEGDEKDVDTLSLDELTAQIQKSIADELAEEEGDEGDDEDEEADGKGADVEARLRKTEAELKAMKAERKRRAELESRKAAGAEVLATVKEFKLSRPQLDRVVKWYQRNPDMEGVVPFREGAMRVLGLGDRVDGDSDGRNGGSPGDRRAHVITRNGGGPTPRREPFKPIASPGDYSNITQMLRTNSKVMRGILR